MENTFNKISDRDALQTLISNSNNQPVVVFKHSNSCPISAAAYREMEKLDGDIVIVEVQTARDISRELAQITGVRHESPQVIILRNGRAVWNASHYDVSAQAVLAVLQAHR